MQGSEIGSPLSLPQINEHGKHSFNHRSRSEIHDWGLNSPGLFKGKTTPNHNE
jgi:hypothetical protein